MPDAPFAVLLADRIYILQPDPQPISFSCVTDPNEIPDSVGVIELSPVQEPGL